MPALDGSFSGIDLTTLHWLQAWERLGLGSGDITPPWLEGFIDLAMEYDKKKIETNLFQLLNIDYIGRPSSLKIAGSWTGQFSKNQWIVWSNQTIHMVKKKGS